MPPSTNSSAVTSLYVSGKNLIVYSFPSRECVTHWDRLLGDIKHHMIALNSVSARENWDDERIVSSLREWFGLVNDFQDAFGVDVIPPDVLRAVSQNNRALQSMKESPYIFPKDAAPCPRYKNCQVLKIISSE
jgi:hypothetical protein